MRIDIIYLVPDLIGPRGGIARYCQNVCRVLSRASLQTSVLVLRDGKENREEAQSFFPGIDYHAFNCSHMSFVTAALKMAFTQRPRLIIVGHPNFSGLGEFMRRISGAPTVVFVYGIDVWRMLPMHVQFGMQRADRIISISNFTIRKALEYGCIKISDEKIRVLHNCLDPIFEQPIKKTRDNETLSLLTVARINHEDRYKGHDIVIKSIPGIIKKYSQLCYDVVGDGDNKSEIEKLAIRMGIDKIVNFHGLVSEKELLDIYSKASIFIMPSRKEGFGFVFLEAMANKLPIIAGNQDATPEVVVDRENGLLVNPTSENEITQAMDQLLGDAQLRMRMGEKGVNRVKKHFSFRLYEEKMLKYLSELNVL